VSGSNDRILRLWDAVSGVHLNTLKGHTGFVKSVAFSPDGTRVVSGSSDNTIQLWDPLSGDLLDTLEGYRMDVNSLALSIKSSQTSFSHDATPDSFYITEDGWIYSFTLQRRVCWLPVSCRPGELSVRGMRVAIGTDGGRVIFLDLTDMDSYFRGL
jgi:predicted NACHT family NTPase